MVNRTTTIGDKKKSGSYRPGTHGHIDPPPGVSGRPETPIMLTDYEKKLFEKICDLLEAADWLKISDGETIHAYVVMKARLEQDPKDFKASNFTQLRMLANELGLSPAARAKMPKQPPKEEINDFDDL